MRWLTLYGTFESVIKDRKKLVNRLNKAETTKDARAIPILKDELSDLEKEMGGFIDLHIKAGWELTDEMKNFKPYFQSSEKENFYGTIYGLADDLRWRKNQGDFKSYEEAYKYGEKHWTVNNQAVTAKQLRNNYFKAKAVKLLDK